MCLETIGRSCLPYIFSRVQIPRALDEVHSNFVANKPLRNAETCYNWETKAKVTFLLSVVIIHCGLRSYVRPGPATERSLRILERGGDYSSAFSACLATLMAFAENSNLKATPSGNIRRVGRVSPKGVRPAGIDIDFTHCHSVGNVVLVVRFHGTERVINIS